MKSKRIIIGLLILIILLSTVSINAFASEVAEEDITSYNSVICIKDGEENYYYEFGMIGATWSNYLSYYNVYNSDSPFRIINGYVTYKNHYIRYRGGSQTLASDTVVQAAGGYYTLGSSLVIVEDNTLRFSVYGVEKTFGHAIEELYGFGLYGDTYSSMYITYEGYAIYYDNTKRPVHEGTNIVLDKRYPLSTSKLCDGVNHRFNRNPSLTKRPTCIETGLMEYNCNYCDFVKEEVIPVDLEYGHIKDCETIIQVTCTTPGKVVYTCQLCDLYEEETVQAHGHNMTEPTCTEPSVCTYGCGKTHEALGHIIVSSVCEGTYCDRCYEYFVEPEGHIINYKNQCTREGCDYVYGEVVDRPVLDWIAGVGSTVGGFFEDLGQGTVNVVQNVGQGFGNWWNNKFVPGWENVVEYLTSGEDGIGLFGKLFGNSDNEDDEPGFDDVWRILIIVLSAIPIITLIYIVIIAVIKIKGKINTMPKVKKTRKRRKRKKV